MSLLPKDEKFYDLLLAQAKLAAEASGLLANAFQTGGTNGGWSSAAGKIRDLERKADEGIHDIYRRLHKTFITPVDPEDIHALATGLDEILDHLDAAAYRLDAFGFRQTPPGMSEIARMVDECVQGVRTAMESLDRDGMKKLEYLSSLCAEINKKESETEMRVRQAIRELFASEKDPIELLKQKEVYEVLEQVADCCEDVADTLEAISVKNS